MRAGVALNRQPLGEERLDGGCQRGHDRCPVVLLEPLRGHGQQFGRGLQVPIRRCGADVTEVGRQQRHPCGDVCPVAIPVEQGRDRETVPEVMHPGTRPGSGLKPGMRRPAGRTSPEHGGW